MRVVFRADASQEEGGGHLVRSLVIARELSKRGHDCILVTQEGSVDLLPGGRDSLPKSNFLTKEIEKSDFDNAQALYNSLPENWNADLAFIDSYRLQKSYQTHVRKFSPKIAVMEDMPVREHDADFLIDPTYNRKTNEYKDLLTTQAIIKTGVDFAPLREEFALYRDQSIERRESQKADSTKHLVISMGLSDPLNATKFAMEALLALDRDLDFDLTVVLGKNSPHQNQIEELAKQFKKPATLLIAHNQMAKLMSVCDLVLGGGGSSSWERCCLGVPSIQLILARNQEDVTNSLAERGAVISFCYSNALNKTRVTSAVNTYLTNNDLLLQTSRAASKICDGDGAWRIANELEKL